MGENSWRSKRWCDRYEMKVSTVRIWNTPFAALTCAPMKCVFVTALAAIGTIAAASSASFWALVRRGFFSVFVADVVFDTVVAAASFSVTTDVVVVSAIATVVVRLRFRLETSATATVADSRD